ncbi:unnamed protein product [Musa acuminata var. zebrina]
MQTHIVHTGQKNLTQVRAFAHAADLLRWVQFSKWRPISIWHRAPGSGEKGSESTNPAAALFSSLCPPSILSSNRLQLLWPYILHTIPFPLLHQIERRELQATSSLHSLGRY